MKQYFFLIVLLMVFLKAGFAMASPSAIASTTSTATGLWLTENGHAVIRIESCGLDHPTALCGRIVWIIQGGMQADAKNPNLSLRERPLCGLPILWGFMPQDATNWIDGHIYKADDGDTYHATLQQLTPDRLRIHGYIGVPLLGVSQIWRRVKAADYSPCHKGI